MSYNHKGKPAYWRLCYRTGWKGWYAAAYHFEGSHAHHFRSSLGAWARSDKNMAIRDQREHEARAAGRRQKVRNQRKISTELNAFRHFVTPLCVGGAPPEALTIASRAFWAAFRASGLQHSQRRPKLLTARQLCLWS
jgi:hypothetical protein